MDWDYEFIAFLFDLVWKGGTVCTLIWLVIRQKTSDNASAIRQLADRVDMHENTLVRIDEKISNAPSHDDLQHIHDRISKSNKLTSKVCEDISRLSAHMTNVLRNLELIDRIHYKDKSS